MPDRFPWRTAAKIAWRESRSAPVKFLFVVLAVAVGVGSFTGVRGFSRAFRHMLSANARTLMGADLTVRVFALPAPEQTAALELLEQRGVRRTLVTETVSMVSSAAVEEPLLVSVKAVDPAVYPFYGEVRLSPPRPLAESLTDDSVAVSEDLLLRLQVNVGEEVRLGGRQFRVAAVVTDEPDRMTGSYNVGPRLMLTRGGLDRTGLIRLGSRAAQRYLLRIPPEAPPVAEVRAMLRKVFPRARMVDFRESHPLITRGLDNATTFLTLVSLVAMMVGAVGVATAMRSHLEQKMDSIAVMKSLGGRSGQILRIYLLQTAMLGLGGSLLGVLLGGFVERVFPLLIARYFPAPPAWRPDPVPALQGLLVGVAVTLLVTLPPLLGVRNVRPNIILRRDMAGPRPGWRQRLAASRAPLAAGVLLAAGIALIVAWLGGSWQVSGLFVGGAAACLALMSGAAWAMLGSLRFLLARAGRLLPPLIRCGVANLYRPGNHAGTVLVALGAGVMFSLTVFWVQRSILSWMVESAPSGMPNVFLVNVTEADRGELAAFVARQPGVQGPPVMAASAEARITAIDGAAVGGPNPGRGSGDRAGRSGGGEFRRTRTVTWARQLPPNTEIVEGRWWSEAAPAEPAVSVAEEAARRMGVGPGSTVDFMLAGRQVKARVACLHRTEAIRPGSSIEYIFSPGVLDGLPLTYYGGVRVEPRAVGRLQKALYERNPTVTVVSVADVLVIVQEVVDQVALVTRFVAAFAILAGVIILASSVAGTRFRRVREVAILKTVGATRWRVAAIFSVEFLVLGSVAGLLGSLLASGFSAIALSTLFREAVYRWDAASNLAAVGLTALVAVGAGWLASARILGRKPLEVLRGE